MLDDPDDAEVPDNASALIALCCSLYPLASDVNLDAIVTYATRLRREVGEFLVGSCVRREPALQRSPAFIRWARGQDAMTRPTVYCASDGRSWPRRFTMRTGMCRRLP